MSIFAINKSVRRLAVALLMICGCSSRAPIPRPETAAFMPDDLPGLFLGIKREEVDRRFPAQNTRLTEDGLETAARQFKDGVEIGLAFAYRDDLLATATIWYDYSQVPGRIDQDRLTFLASMIERNGPDFQPCSFIIPGAKFVPDLGLYWTHPGFRVVVTFSKPASDIPDSVTSQPYFQFSMFDSVTSVVDLWTNIAIPADPAELRYFHEVDSLRNALLARRPPTR